MEKPKPIKRHPDLQPVSREHHQGLLLSFKIREGFKRGIEIERIKKYVNWFWEHHLKVHFEFEEEYIFPILGSDHLLVAQALKEHKRLKELINEDQSIAENLSQLEKEIVAHIRFEERVLFMEIEKNANEKELARIASSHKLITCDVYGDEFWSRK